MHGFRESSLLCRVGNLLCALPLEHVEETMRPLAIEPLAGAPAFVRGLAVVRGIAVPVVDAAALLGVGIGRPTRFVSVKAGSRRVALAVDAVEGIRRIPPASLDALPPLLGNSNADAISAVGTLDAELFLVLRSGRLVPDDLWATLKTDSSVA
ncbi:MAG TPA: chemotaxis protein CheW [Vicinamibacterales bacterium]|nr:chemotaxis protein CheW [Vicinamibacterales bacterium]